MRVFNYKFEEKVIDSRSSVSVKNIMDSVVLEDYNTFELDFANIKRIDAVGFGALIRISKACGERNKKLRFINLDKDIVRVMGFLKIKERMEGECELYVG
jgi:anti-anti-sigma regulatory factor